MRNPSRPLLVSLLAGTLATLAATGCNSKDGDGAASPGGAAPAAAVAQDPGTPAAHDPAAPPAKPHGSHDSAHEGMIIMDGERHVEFVADPTGRLEIWISDGARDPLPASTATAASVTLQPPSGAPTTVALVRDAGDTHWSAKAGPIADPQTKVSFSLAVTGRAVPLTLDLTLAQLREYSKAGAPAGHGGSGPHGGVVAELGDGKAELKVDAATGTFQLWLLDGSGAAQPVAGVNVRVKVAAKGYADVTLAASGDHLAGKGAGITAEHPTAVVVVERGGKTETVRFKLHLEGEGAGGGHDGHH